MKTIIALWHAIWQSCDVTRNECRLMALVGETFAEIDDGAPSEKEVVVSFRLKPKSKRRGGE